jgi:hypothetical protein
LNISQEFSDPGIKVAAFWRFLSRPFVALIRTPMDVKDNRCKIIDVKIIDVKDNRNRDKK